jgi:hypothetical protein
MRFDSSHSQVLHVRTDSSTTRSGGPPRTGYTGPAGSLVTAALRHGVLTAAGWRVLNAPLVQPNRPMAAATDPPVAQREIRRGDTRDHAREAQVVAAYAAPGNASFATAGKLLKISGERVRQIVERWERETGERIPRAVERRRLAKEAEREARRRRAPSLAQRLAARVRANLVTDCWEWVGPLVSTGGGTYPAFRVLGEQFAHRVAYRMWVGEIPQGHYLAPACAGRFCINPFHRFPISAGEAVRARRPGLGRTRQSPRTRCRRGHELSEDNITWNSSYTKRGGVWVKVRTRLCSICHRERQRRNYKARPPLPVDPHEKAVERSIRRIESARAADRQFVLQRELACSGDDLSEVPPAGPNEPWEDYVSRTGGNFSFGSWLASRIAGHPRTATALAKRPRSTKAIAPG